MAALTPGEIAYQESHINQDQGPKVIAVSSVLIFITTLVVFLRLVARSVRSLPYGWDDAFTVAAWVLVLCINIINIVSVHFGLGKHLLATDPSQGYKILEAGFFLSLAYSVGQWFIKISILLTYVRIFTLRIKWFKWAVILTGFYVTAWSLSLTITVLTQCRPLSYFWQQYNISLQPPATGVCTINSNATEVTTSALNTVADFILLFLPIGVLSQLKISRSRKIAVTSIFAVGIFACVAGILRLVSTLTVIAAGTDSTWNTVGVYLWTAVEACVGLMCGCFPIVGPLLPIIRDKIRTMSISTSFANLFSGGRGRRNHPNHDYELDTTRREAAGNTESMNGDIVKSSDVLPDPSSIPNGQVMRVDTFSVTKQQRK